MVFQLHLTNKRQICRLLNPRLVCVCAVQAFVCLCEFMCACVWLGTTQSSSKTKVVPGDMLCQVAEA